MISTQRETPAVLVAPASQLALRRTLPKQIAYTIAAVIFVAAAVAIPFSSAIADLGTPMQTAQSMVNRAVSILANTSMPVNQRRRELRNAIASNFDFTEMSRSALGYNWRSLTPAQRADFTHVFSSFLEDAYLSKIQDYSGQQVQFTGQTPLGPGYVQINSSIVQPGKNSVPVNYLLMQRNGGWKIYDVTVDAISIIANYRNQFNRVINEKGFDQLMADLRAKQEQLAADLGSN